MLEVFIGHVRLILSAKYSDLKARYISLDLTRLHARNLEVLDILIDYFVGINVLSDFFHCPVMCDEFWAFVLANLIKVISGAILTSRVGKVYAVL